MVYAYLFFALFFNATANILMKHGALSLSDGLVSLIKHPLNILNHWAILAGVFLFVLARVFCTLVLMKLNLSIAYPLMTSLGFLIVIGYSVFFLNESFFWYQLAGVLLILIGLGLVSLGIK
jgi:multidrug transporter EmrE-like cation transporter